MSLKLRLRVTSAIALGLGLGLMTATASATPVTPKFRFLDFYANGLYASTTPDNVDYFVNDSVTTKQLCAFGPANGSTTVIDCSLRGDGGIDFSETGDPVRSVEWWLVNKDEPPATREWFHNSLSFTPGNSYDVTTLPTGRFKFGTLTYTNGSWGSLTDAMVSLSYELTFTTGNAALDAAYDFEYSGALVVAATPNNLATREDRADYVYLAGEEHLGSLRAFEFADVNYVPGANTVSVDIYGNLASVHFTDFANVRGGGFVNPSVTGPLAPVPEPGTLSLALAAVAASFAVGRAQRRR